MANWKESKVFTYDNVRSIVGFTFETSPAETETNYYEKEFRTSQDGVLWSDWKELTNKNLSKVKVCEGKSLYIMYRWNKVGERDIEITNFELDIEDITGNEGTIPACFWNTVTDNAKCPAVPQIVYECSSCGGNNLFNPYSLGNATSIYNQLSALVSNMFGFCVTYFKTSPEANSRDVILKEYSLEKVIDQKSVKILIPDNALPTKELQFNPMMIDYPVQFEVHIVKSEFKNVFGEYSHPDPHDYIYFQSYMNKMYMVDSVAEPDDFAYTGSYWRVSLVPYQERSAVHFDTEDLKEDTETLILSAETKFADEVADEYADNRKDPQYNDIGDIDEGHDFIRRVLDPNLKIRDEKIYNHWTVISNQFYAMDTITRGDTGVQYRYNEGFEACDERMLSLVFKPTNPDGNLGDNIIITSIGAANSGNAVLTVQNWDKLFVAGNFVKIRKANSSINGFQKIVSVNRSRRLVEIDVPYSDDTLSANSVAVANECNMLFCGYGDGSDNDSVFEVMQTHNQIIVNINGTMTFYDLGFDFEDKWYLMALGMHEMNSNVWMYELSNGTKDNDSMDNKMALVASVSNEVGDYKFASPMYYELQGGNVDITNIRLWKKLCEEKLHNLVFSQYVVDDMHNILIIDNAKNEMLLNSKWS